MCSWRHYHFGSCLHATIFGNDWAEPAKSTLTIFNKTRPSLASFLMNYYSEFDEIYTVNYLLVTLLQYAKQCPPTNSGNVLLSTLCITVVCKAMSPPIVVMFSCLLYTLLQYANQCLSTNSSNVLLYTLYSTAVCKTMSSATNGGNVLLSTLYITAVCKTMSPHQ